MQLLSVIMKHRTEKETGKLVENCFLRLYVCFLMVSGVGGVWDYSQREYMRITVSILGLRSPGDHPSV